MQNYMSLTKCGIVDDFNVSLQKCGIVNSLDRSSPVNDFNTASHKCAIVSAFNMSSPNPGNILEPICEDATISPEPIRSQKSPITPSSPVLNFKFFPKSTSLFRLKCTTSRLGLDNRRPSIEAWKKSYKGKSLRTLMPTCITEDYSDDDEFSHERINKINESLSWLKEELIQMKKQDQALASQFLRIRKAIYNLKLDWSCMDHRCMLEDAESEIDTIEELRRVTDLPIQPDLDSSLIQKGFTKFNMSTRRYSLA